MAILVWMYSHQLCLGLITEEEVDSDKIYDAFISYAHEDEDFVRNELLPKLEDDDPKYKICVHWRDWIGGELIQTQILKSVKTSRRIIVVLSENFVRSSWGQDEFRSAHRQALEDKTNRVILVVYGEVPPNDVLDEELRHYIRSHTYIKWDNPKFWDQLNFAMPHRKQFPRKKITKQETIKMDRV